LHSHSATLRSGHITADMRLGSCRASTQIAFGNFSYPHTLGDILLGALLNDKNIHKIFKKRAFKEIQI